MAGVLHRRRQRRGDVSPDVGERLQLAHRGRGGHRRVGGQAPPYGPPGESVSESTTVGGGAQTGHTCPSLPRHLFTEITLRGSS